MKKNEKLKEKIKFKDIVLQALLIYKDNKKALFTLSFVYLILANLGNGFVYMRSSNISLKYSNSYTLILLIAAIIAFIASVYNIQVNAAMILSVRDAYMSERLGAWDAYKNANGLKGKIFVTSLLLGFMLLIPILLISTSFIGEFGLITKIALLLVGGTFTFLILIFYGFAPIIVALEPNLDSHFSRSKNIVKGHIVTVILVKLLSSISIISDILIYLFKMSMDFNLQSQVIGFIVENVIRFLFVPFFVSLTVVTILKLTKEYLRNEKNQMLLGVE